VPRDYAQRTPKKMKAAALRGALSDRARNDRVHVVSGLVAGDSPSTRDAATALAAVSQARHVLVVAERTDFVTWLSVRNIPTVHLLEPGQLNTYDVLVSDDVVFTQGALEAFLAGPATGKSAKGVASSDELDDDATAVAEAELAADVEASVVVDDDVTAIAEVEAEAEAEAGADEKPAAKVAAKKAPAKKEAAKKAPATKAAEADTDAADTAEDEADEADDDADEKEDS
jgi:large subunit ribosomal protein L4